MARGRTVVVPTFAFDTAWGTVTAASGGNGPDGGIARVCISRARDPARMGSLFRAGPRQGCTPDVPGVGCPLRANRNAVDSDIPRKESKRLAAASLSSLCPSPVLREG